MSRKVVHKEYSQNLKLVNREETSVDILMNKWKIDVKELQRTGYYNRTHDKEQKIQF